MFQWMSKKLNQKRKGFTLIELVVVVAILGILAALAVPRFTNFRDTAAKTTVEADARSILSAFEVYNAEKGSYPTTDTELDAYLNTASLGGTITYGGTGTLFTFAKTVNSTAYTASCTTNGVITVSP